MSPGALAIAENHSGALPLAALQRVLVWLLMASSWFVIIEPAPYEVLFALALIIFLPAGLAATRWVLPLIVFLVIYNAGGAVALVPVMNDGKAVKFILISIYMAITAIFFAFAVTRRPLEMFAVIRNGWIVAGVLAAITGLVGFFNLAGLGEAWAPIGRAQGTFKDPNVLSTFLIAPFIFLLQGFLTGEQRHKFISGLALLTISASLFLAFSRGAWINAAGSALMMFTVMFLVSTSLNLRARIVLSMIVGSAVLVMLILAVMSIPQVRDMFLERASLVQSYDGGETGRFGAQINSIPLLLDRINGMGPLQFHYYFGNDPHNVYLNAFASYGWAGGIAYFLLVIATVTAGWQAMFTRSPAQMPAIACFSVLFMTMLQGVQIDTDHWRHFYALLGMVWGFFAASRLALAQSRLTPAG